MADHLAQALLALRDAQEEMNGTTEATLYAAATAHAAIDAAETGRRLEGYLSAIEAHVAVIVDVLTAGANRAPEPTNAAEPDGTPQVGEVWEDTTDGERVLVREKPDYRSRLECRVVVQGGAHNKPGDTVGRYVRTDEGWRRVSPATAPLTEREVTAQVEGEADVNAAILLGDERLARMQARAERAEAYRRNLLGLVEQREAALKRAEAEVERMRPVVDAAVAWNKEVVAPHYLSLPAQNFHKIVAAYRAAQEATDG